MLATIKAGVGVLILLALAAGVVLGMIEKGLIGTAIVFFTAIVLVELIWWSILMIGSWLDDRAPVVKMREQAMGAANEEKHS